MNKKRSYTDKEIVEGCSKNDRYFQELVYKQYFPKMLSLCLRYTQDRGKAMEIVNNGFLRVFKKVHTFSSQGSFEGWVRKLVYNSISDYYRKNKKYGETMVFEEKETSQEAKVIGDLYAKDILKYVSKLPPATSKVFELYVLEGFTHAEIGKKLSISDGTSKWHLASARKSLKLMLKQQKKNSYEKQQ